VGVEAALLVVSEQLPEVDVGITFPMAETA